MLHDEAQLKRLIVANISRLHKLEEKQAFYGKSVDPQIPIEIEEINATIQMLKTELEATKLQAEQRESVDVPTNNKFRSFPYPWIVIVGLVLLCYLVLKLFPLQPSPVTEPNRPSAVAVILPTSIPKGYHPIATITTPSNGDIVDEIVYVEGLISGLRPTQQAFLCIQSEDYGRKIYPQHRIYPDANGKWTVESIYKTPGANYITYVVATDKRDLIELLSRPESRLNGIDEWELPSAPISKVFRVILASIGLGSLDQTAL